MITANDLRIGNWIYDKYNAPVQCTIEHLSEAVQWRSSWGAIPLTEEILLKAGFEKKDIGSGNIVCFDLDSFQINTYKESSKEGFWIRQYPSPKHKRFNYVHQLQNLYHALTGEELKINL